VDFLEELDAAKLEKRRRYIQSVVMIPCNA